MKLEIEPFQMAVCQPPELPATGGGPKSFKRQAVGHIDVEEPRLSGLEKPQGQVASERR